MAVEARRFTLLNQDFTQERDSFNDSVFWQPYTSNQIRFPSDLEMPSANLISNQLPPLEQQQQQQLRDSIPAKEILNNVSGLRKRSADSLDEFRCASESRFSSNQTKTSFCFSGDEILSHIQLSQFEIDAIIAQHTKRVRLGLEQKQKQQLRFLEAAIDDGVMKKLKEKDEQIQRIGTVNKLLQERVKTLYTENQLWRDVAQTNEATANSLRTNLEQLLQFNGDNRFSGDKQIIEDDAVSSCGSTGNPDPDDNRLCRRCQEREACVLLLPCRHLSLCTACGSGPYQPHSCPVCNCTTNATLHVNMSI